MRPFRWTVSAPSRTGPVARWCSTRAAGTADGHGLLGRNYDFPTVTLSEFLGGQPWPDERPMVADPWIVEMHPTDGHASVCLVMGDVMGAMDGINSAGLAVALLADDVHPPLEASGRPQVGLSEIQVVRYLLDTCATVDEAKDALRIAKHYYQGLPCHFLIADRHGGSFVWEHSRHRNREIIVEPDDRARQSTRVHQPPVASLARCHRPRRRRSGGHRHEELRPMAGAHRGLAARNGHGC